MQLHDVEQFAWNLEDFWGKKAGVWSAYTTSLTVKVSIPI